VKALADFKKHLGWTALAILKMASLRHFYAVNALRSGVCVFAVARNTGTSVQMIQEYYGKQATAAVFQRGSVIKCFISGYYPRRRAT
jgi:hypothetical protein